MGRSPEYAQMVVCMFLTSQGPGRLSLDVLSFGVRHHPQDSKAPTVYEIADARLKQ